MKNLMHYFTDTIKANANLFTIFAATLVIIVGIAIVDNRDNWWLSGIAVLVFFLVVFIFMNARVVIKSTLTIIMTLIMSTFAFQIGSMYDPMKSAGFIWMFQILFAFFAMISISYLFQSYKSRWGTSAISIITSFSITSAMMVSGIPSIVAIITGIVIGISQFIFSYIISVKVFKGVFSFKKKSMPQNTSSEKILETLAKTLDNNKDLNIKRVTAIEDDDTEKEILKKKKKAEKHLKKQNITLSERNIEANIEKNTSSILAYGKYAYAIRPVDMETYFMEKGKKSKRLTYRNKNISSWLLSMNFNEIPSWKTQNIPIMLVLLDVNGGNGKDMKVIGVPLPDSNKRIPIAIVPAKNINNKDKKKKVAYSVLKHLEELDKYNQELTEKEISHLDLVGKIESE